MWVQDYTEPFMERGWRLRFGERRYLVESGLGLIQHRLLAASFRRTRRSLSATARFRALCLRQIRFSQDYLGCISGRKTSKYGAERDPSSLEDGLSSANFRVTNDMSLVICEITAIAHN